MPCYKPLHYAERLRARNETIREGFFEGVLTTRDLGVVSGLTANLFVRTGEGVWLTPHADSGCLPGVTRALLLEGDSPEPVFEREVRLHDLTEATGVLMTNSGIGVQPVTGLRIEEDVEREFDTGPSILFLEWYESLKR